jgi:hypothetical protein
MVRAEWKPAMLRTRGRALLIGSDGSLYVSRKYEIFRSRDGGRAWHRDCFISMSPIDSAMTVCSAGRRLLRRNIQDFAVLDDGARLAVARDGIYRAEPGEPRMHRVFAIARGSRPLNLACVGKRVSFGEYGAGLDSEEVAIYGSEDGGSTFGVGFRFPRGAIGHVHNIQFDSYTGHYWVLTGDYGPQAGIGVLEPCFRSFHWLCRGDQRFRAVSVLIGEKYLTYGTDSSVEGNWIGRLDKSTGKFEELLKVEGSSLYAGQFGSASVITTCVEPNPACPSTRCSIYTSHDRIDWHRLETFEKDWMHTQCFQFGTIVLPKVTHDCPPLMYSGQALRRAHDSVWIDPCGAALNSA